MERRSIETTLDLLWTGLGRPRRGPGHQITVRELVEAAMGTLEAEGVEALSMRKVAARLGVGAATLYTYVPDKAALFALMTDEIVGRAPLPHTRPGTWRDKTAAWAREDLAAHREHPWITGATDSPYIGPNALAWTDSAIRVFDGTGLNADEALAAVEAVDGLVRGHVAKVVAADRAERRRDPEGRSFTTIQTDYLTARRAGEGRFPAVERLSGPLDPVAAFEWALGRLLDGVEYRIAVSGGETGRGAGGGGNPSKGAGGGA